MNIKNRVGAAVLSLAFMLAIVAPVSAQSFGGSLSGRDKAKYIGGGAAAGAVIGGLLKGGKGAAIGALIGAGAGAATVYIKGRREEDRYRYDSRYYNNGYYNNGYYDSRYNNRYDYRGYTYRNNFRGYNYRSGARCNR